MSDESSRSDTPAAEGERPKLRDRVHEAMRRRYFSQRTEEAYVHWIKRFIYFSGRRHPADLRETEVTAFLNHLAVERQVAPATQNQALSALLFLYREVLGRQLEWLDGMQRASRPPRLPVVLTRAEVERLLACLEGEMADRQPPLRFRAAGARMSAPARKGGGPFVSAGPRARRKRRKRPGHDAARKAHRPAAAAS